MSRSSTGSTAGPKNEFAFVASPAWLGFGEGARWDDGCPGPQAPRVLVQGDRYRVRPCTGRQACGYDGLSVEVLRWSVWECAGLTEPGGAAFGHTAEQL
jgi:hypothetical protein